MSDQQFTWVLVLKLLLYCLFLSSPSDTPWYMYVQICVCVSVCVCVCLCVNSTQNSGNLIEPQCSLILSWDLSNNMTAHLITIVQPG